MQDSISFLVVEDDELSKLSLRSLLSDYGRVAVASSASQARELLDQNDYNIAFIDLDLESELAGLELIPKTKCQNVYTVVVSGREEDSSIIEAYSLGCEDYLTKPFTKQSLELILRKYQFLKKQGKLKDFFNHQYITQDETLVRKLDCLGEIVASRRPVLLQGETGTGKTMMANLIHEMIYPKGAPFISLNCSEVPENLIESELFGHTKGSFSGAESDKKGRLHLADKGTLFLDEIATMPMSMQKKLLTAIDEKKFYPLGSEEPVQVDFFLISATCEDLSQLVSDHIFREDLFYRIEGFNISLPSLRNRKDDLPLLIKHFIKKGMRRIVFDESAIACLQKYHWPGNIRELQKLISLMQAKTSGIIHKKDLPRQFHEDNEPETMKFLDDEQMSFIEANGLKSFIENIEAQVVKHFYERNEEKVRQTLGQLKISNSAFYRIMERVKGGNSDES